jgi:hypothetical protein
MLHATKLHRCAVWASVDPDDPEGVVACEECGAPLLATLTRDLPPDGYGGLTISLPAQLVCGCAAGRPANS